MYYEAKSVLTSHPDLCYDDGRINYFFYGKGKNNLPNEKFDVNTVAGLMRYIVTGEKNDESQSVVGQLDNIVNTVKNKAEVTKNYMKEWDRRRLHDIELTKQVREEDAIDLITLFREEGFSDEKIKEKLIKQGKFKSKEIDDLLLRANEVVVNT